jgi:hypothetical protein
MFCRCQALKQLGLHPRSAANLRLWIKIKRKRTMSASARRKSAAFQRVRWAKVKAQEKKAA